MRTSAALLSFVTTENGQSSKLGSSPKAPGTGTGICLRRWRLFHALLTEGEGSF